MTRPTHEIDAYLDGEPTPDQVRALQAWIQADRANAKQFLAAIRLHQQIGTQLRKDRFDLALQSSTQSATTKDGDAAIQALAELARLHDEGLKQPFDPELHHKQRIHHAHAGQAQPLRLKTKLILTGSFAACIALAGLAVLIVNLFTGPEQEIADQTDDTLAVATLTAERDAKWAPAGGASAPPANLSVGSKLHPNQRLTLTAGFAEITTNRGAIAILEAPATIELLNNDNALRLHAGKLVGICDAPLSKGFLVRTPHLDVTDIGTRFGVDATSPLATEIHVLDGSVRVEDRLTRSGGSAQTLSMGQAARVSDQAQGIARIDHNPSSFDAITPIVIELPGTGNDLTQILDQQKQGQVENLRLKRIGEVDRNWLVVAREGQPLERPGSPKVVSPKLYGDENADPSQWLHWSRTKRPDDHQETFLFQTEVTVPGSIDARSASISLACATDNRLLAIHVNGQRIAVEPGDTNDYGMDPYVIDQHLVAGVNTIGFEVMNNWRPGKDYTSNGVALRVSWQLHGMPQQGASPTDSN